MQKRRPICDHCELLPHRMQNDIAVYLSAPVMGTREKLIAAGERAGVEIKYVDEVMRVDIPASQLGTFAETMRATLANRELEDTKSLLTDPDREPRLTDLIHMQSLDTIVARIEGQRIIELLEHGRLTTHIHEIVAAHDPTDVFAYECLTRGIAADGSVIAPGELFGTARKAGLLFYLDRESRVQAIRSGADVARPAKLFINFNPATIYTPEYCLKTTMNALEEVGLGREDIIFEVVESDHTEDTDHLLGILDYYRSRGFKVALDDLGAGYNSLTTLTRLQPDFMKLDLELVRDVDRDPFKEAIVRNLLLLAGELGITTIAEGIEREGEAEWLRNAGADYLQGFLFGKPHPIGALPVADS